MVPYTRARRPCCVIYVLCGARSFEPSVNVTQPSRHRRAYDDDRRAMVTTLTALFRRARFVSHLMQLLHNVESVSGVIHGAAPAQPLSSARFSLDAFAEGVAPLTHSQYTITCRLFIPLLIGAFGLLGPHRYLLRGYACVVYLRVKMAAFIEEAFNECKVGARGRHY